MYLKNSVEIIHEKESSVDESSISGNKCLTFQGGGIMELLLKMDSWISYLNILPGFTKWKHN